jgi:hypothetical protein
VEVMFKMAQIFAKSYDFKVFLISYMLAMVGDGSDQVVTASTQPQLNSS